MNSKKHTGIGKKVGNKLYIHRESLDVLPEHLRVRVIEAEWIRHDAGLPNWWTVAKMTPEDEYGPISLLTYHGFEHIAHPVLSASIVVRIRGHVPKISERSYSGLIIHRKELMVGPTQPDRELWEVLTEAEERCGLLSKLHSPHIGRKTYWDALLAEKGLRIAHHTLVQRSNGKRA